MFFRALQSRCEHHSEPEFNGKQKPLQIIDGQHRTRGMNAWENYRMLFPEYSGSCPHHSNKTQCDADGCTSWQEMDEVITEAVPVTISHFNNQKGDQENKAAIFLEVNTKAEDRVRFTNWQCFTEKGSPLPQSKLARLKGHLCPKNI